MARNKREIDKEAKREQIVAAAQALFLTQSYEETSMSALAAEVGVAPNTLYWYFANKDELLVAVLNVTLDKVFQDLLQQTFVRMEQQMVWLYEQLRVYHKFVVTVHARIEVSPLLAEWHARFHQMVDGLFTWWLTREGFAPDKIDAWRDVCTLTIEGLLSHHYPAERARRALEILATSSSA